MLMGVKSWVKKTFLFDSNSLLLSIGCIDMLLFLLA